VNVLREKHTKFLLVLLLASVLYGCAVNLKEAGIDRFVGQTLFNRVNFRTFGENRIYYTNRIYGGILIPAGTNCTIKSITSTKIWFITSGDEYVLIDWRGKTESENIKALFDKFFVEDREGIGLDKIYPDFREKVLSGIAEVGMTKEEVLVCAGYPAYIGYKDRTLDDDRERILAQNDWYYLKTRRRKVLYRFSGEKLNRIIGQ